MNGTSPCPSCGSAAFCGSIITIQPNYVVKENIYEIEHVYPGPGNYLLYSFDANRNNGVINIPNSINQPFYLQSLIIINANGASNSSPVSANPPLGLAANVNCFYHQPSATDAEGDSLSYELWASQNQNGPVPGFTFPATGAGGYFFITNTGLLHWCRPQTLGEYNFSLLIREWRKNNTGVYVQNGYVMRETQVLVKQGALALSENDGGDLPKVYPSPFKDRLIIDPFQNPQQLKMYSSNGNLVLSRTNLQGGNLEIDTEHVLPGMYILAIESQGRWFYKKVIKE